MSEQTTILSNQVIRLVFSLEGGRAGGYSLEVFRQGGWHRMGASQPLSQVIYKDKSGQRQVVDLTAEIVQADDQQVCLRGSQPGPDGVIWTLSACFTLDEYPNQVKVDYWLDVSENRPVLRWLGPSLLAGEGSFGSAKDESLFPGLEYLLAGELSSDTRFAAEKYARRYVPNPYKITIPLMAVSHEGCSAGLMWDPNQDWNNAWRHPAALFSSPNRLTPEAENHWMAIFAPAVDPRWLNEGELEAHSPCGLGKGHPWALSARLVAFADGGLESVLRAWVETYGLPPLPEAGFDYQADMDLCIKSFLDVAWDEQAEGWHHTLSDPWGPRFEANAANLLWHYGRWQGGSPVQRARARDQVRRAVGHAVQRTPGSAPHLDLAFTYGQMAVVLDAAASAARQAMAEQQADGSWPWKPAAVHDSAEFKTSDRLAVMGQEGDSATGLTGSRVAPVLKYALATGDPAAVASIRRAADWCNRQRRPEGAQTWELHLHVPDVLAVPHLIRLNLGVYTLTGEAGYLQAANHWAWTGLPFTYLWSAYFRPIMRYGTIPVFGVTFHDVQSWFGVIVQWNGLVYAEALLQLAKYIPADGRLNWRTLAEGIARHGMQQQITYGPFLGMYPDAYSAVKSDEEYTWWLNPQLVGLVTFPLAGLPVAPETTILSMPDRKVQITSGATLVKAGGTAPGQVQLLLSDQAGQASTILVAGISKPSQVSLEGLPLAETSDLDGVDQGWQHLPAHGVVAIKVLFASETANLVIQL